MNYTELVKLSNHDLDKYYENVISDQGYGQRRRALALGVCDTGGVNVHINYSITERPAIVGSQYGPMMHDPDVGKYLYHEEVPYSTGSGTRMSLYIQIVSRFRDTLPMLTEWEHVASCGDCKGSSGGCPGFAPRFPSIKPKLPMLYLLIVTLDMAWAMEYTTKKVHNTGLSIPWANRISAGYARRILKAVPRDKDHYTIGLGSCAGSWHKCRPSCKVILGERCQYPKLRSYSMEAVGIDCDMLHFQLFNERLPWAYKGIKGLPTYMTRYAGILAREGAANEIVTALKLAMHSDKSRTFDAVTNVPIHDAEFSTIPSDLRGGFTAPAATAGCTQAFYMFGAERTGYYE